MKYPIQWGISYNDKTYMRVYGKKKAHDLCQLLSGSLQNLSVVPLRQASAREILMFRQSPQARRSRRSRKS